MLRIYPKALGQLKPRGDAPLYPYGPCEGRRTDEFKEQDGKCVPTFADTLAPQPSERGLLKDVHPFTPPTPGTESQWAPLVKWGALGIALYAVARAGKWGAGTIRDEVKGLSPRQEVLALGPMGSEKKGRISPKNAKALMALNARLSAALFGPETPRRAARRSWRTGDHVILRDGRTGVVKWCLGGAMRGHCVVDLADGTQATVRDTHMKHVAGEKRKPYRGIDLRNDYDEKAPTENGTIYRKGGVVQAAEP